MCVTKAEVYSEVKLFCRIGFSRVIPNKGKTRARCSANERAERWLVLLKQWSASRGAQKGKARARPMTTQNGVPYYLSHGAEARSKGCPKGKGALEPIESIHQ